MTEQKKKISERTQTNRCWAKCDTLNYSSGRYLNQQLRIGRNADWHVASEKTFDFWMNSTASFLWLRVLWQWTYILAAQPTLPDVGPVWREAAFNWDAKPVNMSIFTKSAPLSHSIRPSCHGLTSLGPLLWVMPGFNINFKHQTCQIHLSGVSCSSTRCSLNWKCAWWISHCLQTYFDLASLCNVFCDYRSVNPNMSTSRQLSRAHDPLTAFKAGPASSVCLQISLI